MDPITALRTCNDAVTLFASLAERKSHGMPKEELHEQWAQFVTSLGDCTVESPDGEPDTTLTQMIATLSRLLGDDAIEAAISPLTGSRGRLRGLPRHSTSSPTANPPAGEKKTGYSHHHHHHGEGCAGVRQAAPELQKAPMEVGLDGGLTDQECMGFRLEM